MSQPLLLDEMFSDDIARQLRAAGYDVISVVADPALVGLPDDQVLAYAATEGRTLVTANIKDFVPLDGRYRAAGQAHAGLILVSTKAFPQKRGFPAAFTTSLAALLGEPAKVQSGQMLFLTRPSARAVPRSAPSCTSLCRVAIRRRGRPRPWCSSARRAGSAQAGAAGASPNRTLPVRPGGHYAFATYPAGICDVPLSG
jgi:Domain of unknown function (DUF5615)